MGWSIVPWGFRKLLLWIQARYRWVGLPPFWPYFTQLRPSCSGHDCVAFLLYIFFNPLGLKVQLDGRYPAKVIQPFPFPVGIIMYFPPYIAGQP